MTISHHAPNRQGHHAVRRGDPPSCTSPHPGPLTQPSGDRHPFATYYGSRNVTRGPSRAGWERLRPPAHYCCVQACVHVHVTCGRNRCCTACHLPHTMRSHTRPVRQPDHAARHDTPCCKLARGAERPSALHPGMTQHAGGKVHSCTARPLFHQTCEPCHTCAAIQPKFAS